MHDGTWAANQIRASSQVPIIFLTAFGDEETINEARVSAPYAHLLKPFEDDALMRTVKGALSAP
jgi:CheY-like chemotaxis protein